MRLLLRILMGIGVFIGCVIVGTIFLPNDLYHITQISFSIIATTFIMIMTRKKPQNNVIGSTDSGIYGFGGFLYLIMFGLFLSFRGAVYGLYQNIELRGSENFKTLADPSNYTYSLLWTINYWSVFVYCIIIIALSFLALFLCYKKKKLFKPVMILFYIITFLGNLSFYIFGLLINKDFGYDIINNETGLMYASVYFFVISLLCIAYFLRSKRVKNTFSL